MERLQKILARAGIASRRKAETYIQEGRVRVNGRIVTELGTRADPRADRIEVDGRRIHMPRASTYLLLYKPTGVVTTASDEQGRRTVLDCIKGHDARLFPVGRLDRDAEGALLLTDDGDLAAALTHPSGEVPKIYRARVRGVPNDATLARLMQGIDLEDGPAKAQHVHRVAADRPDPRSPSTWIELTVTEGRNHLIKRLFTAIGHPVQRLRRIQFAHLTLDGLRPGDWRPLRGDELRKLRALARRAQQKRRGPRPPQNA